LTVGFSGEILAHDFVELTTAALFASFPILVAWSGKRFFTSAVIPSESFAMTAPVGIVVPS
jgi:hypothetical protein